MGPRETTRHTQTVGFSASPSEPATFLGTAKIWGGISFRSRAARSQKIKQRSLCRCGTRRVFGEASRSRCQASAGGANSRWFDARSGSRRVQQQLGVFGDDGEDVTPAERDPIDTGRKGAIRVRARRPARRLDEACHLARDRR
jgi:hypothetical protein